MSGGFWILNTAINNPLHANPSVNILTWHQGDLLASHVTGKFFDILIMQNCMCVYTLDILYTEIFLQVKILPFDLNCTYSRGKCSCWQRRFCGSFSPSMNFSTWCIVCSFRAVRAAQDNTESSDHWIIRALPPGPFTNYFCVLLSSLLIFSTLFSSLLIFSILFSSLLIFSSESKFFGLFCLNGKKKHKEWTGNSTMLSFCSFQKPCMGNW